MRQIANLTLKQTMTVVKWYLTHKEDIDALIKFVQENQALFGNPPAGTSVFKLILNVLKGYKTWTKQ